MGKKCRKYAKFYKSGVLMYFVCYSVIEEAIVAQMHLQPHRKFKESIGCGGLQVRRINRMASFSANKN